ncbi:hypothetical protein VR46_37750, partial [Streptomyces sp. NRRL S-444]
MMSGSRTRAWARAMSGVRAGVGDDLEMGVALDPRPQPLQFLALRYADHQDCHHDPHSPSVPRVGQDAAEPGAVRRAGPGRAGRAGRAGRTRV